MVERIGLLAGHLELPVIWAKEATKKKYSIVCLTISQETEVERLRPFCEKIYSIPLGQLQEVMDTLKEERITEVVMVGMVPKEEIYGTSYDTRLKKLMVQLPDLTTDVLLKALALEFQREGISLREQTSFIQHLLAKKGALTRRHPDAAMLRDMEFGYSMAKGIGALDIGQSVVVKDGTVLAAEAIEGTDRAIQRGGSFVKGAIVAKVSKPNQDMCFDIPIVGPLTLNSMEKMHISGLVLEAGKCLILEYDKFLDEADKKGIVIYAMEGDR